jgi:hypothetical protein
VAIRAAKLGFVCGLVALAVSACSDASTDAESAAGEINQAAPCTVFHVQKGKVMSAADLADLDDPVAKLIIQGQACPTSLSDIQAKLVKTDPCAPPNPSGAGVDDDGLRTFFVSDRAQLLDRPDTYRAIVSRACHGRQDEELLMNAFGFEAHADASGKVTSTNVPQTVELIGEQIKSGPGAKPGERSGVFNFYAVENDTWKFFGSSTDFLSQGYDCNADGACVPKAATAQRCAACHAAGGLVMKDWFALAKATAEARMPGIPEGPDEDAVFAFFETRSAQHVDLFRRALQEREAGHKGVVDATAERLEGTFRIDWTLAEIWAEDNAV